MALGVRRGQLTSQISIIWALWPYQNHGMSLSLVFFIEKTISGFIVGVRVVVSVACRQRANAEMRLSQEQIWKGWKEEQRILFPFAEKLWFFFPRMNTLLPGQRKTRPEKFPSTITKIGGTTVESALHWFRFLEKALLTSLLSFLLPH